MINWRNPDCPKCGQKMAGPRWRSATNDLVYSCACGYSESRPANDDTRGRNCTCGTRGYHAHRPGCPSLREQPA